MLGGFRRGVRSMRMVGDSQIDGLVPLIEAYELPPTIVMPFVEGVSLQEAFERRSDLSWETKIRISSRVAEIVSRAHALPSTILHRDLKPSNIMIENFEYQGDFDPVVKVLDFDMSWHKGSKEKDVIFESRDDFGFLSPEQTGASPRYHAQTTKVDSYGFGMTIYFMFGGVAPLANEPLNPTWARSVRRAVSRDYRYDWISAPTKLARIVVKATSFDQAERVDFFRLRNQLNLIEKSIVDPLNVSDSDFWGEELLARIGASVDYVWDDEGSCGHVSSPSGITVSVISNFRDQSIDLKIEYSDSGAMERSGRATILRQRLDMALRELKDAGWQKGVGNVLMGGLVINATISVGDLSLSSPSVSTLSKLYRKFLA